MHAKTQMTIARRPLIRALPPGAGGLALGGCATALDVTLAGRFLCSTRRPRCPPGDLSSLMTPTLTDNSPEPIRAASAATPIAQRAAPLQTRADPPQATRRGQA